MTQPRAEREFLKRIVSIRSKARALLVPFVSAHRYAYSGQSNSFVRPGRTDVDPEDWGPTFNLALLDHSRDNVRSVLHTVEENLEAANKALDTARVALRDLCREDDEYDGWLNRPYPYHKKITKAEYRESVEHRVKRRRRFEE